MRIHYISNELLNPVDPIKICVIGVGGTGSHLLQGLGRMNQALKMLGHLGLHVTAFDADTISTSNVGRQIFHQSDIGENKAVNIITKMNRYYGTDWNAHDTNFIDEQKYNFIMICVDSVKSRKEIMKMIGKAKNSSEYIFDFGNGDNFGQIFISTIGKIKQPKFSNCETVNFIEYPKDVIFNAAEDANEPSCSLWEALVKQDLFINPMIAELGLSLLWKMLRKFNLTERGVYLNLNNYKTNPIKL